MQPNRTKQTHAERMEALRRRAADLIADIERTKAEHARITTALSALARSERGAA